MDKEKGLMEVKILLLLTMLIPGFLRSTKINGDSGRVGSHREPVDGMACKPV